MSSEPPGKPNTAMKSSLAQFQDLGAGPGSLRDRTLAYHHCHALRHGLYYPDALASSVRDR